VTHVADGTEVTVASTTDVTGSPRTSTFQYIIHPDGSISIPVNFDGSGGGSFTYKGVFWPTPAQLATGQPVDETPMVSVTISGKTTTVTTHAVVRGEGTQSVTVPAGTYTATLVDDLTTEKIEGYTTIFDIKTWLANGVGPVKEDLTSGSGSSALTIVQELTSFTKG
jgi:hypothetical protein